MLTVGKLANKLREKQEFSSDIDILTSIGYALYYYKQNISEYAVYMPGLFVYIWDATETHPHSKRLGNITAYLPTCTVRP